MDGDSFAKIRAFTSKSLTKKLDQSYFHRCLASPNLKERENSENHADGHVI